jgi:hypothetical protein
MYEFNKQIVKVYKKTVKRIDGSLNKKIQFLIT